MPPRLIPPHSLGKPYTNSPPSSIVTVQLLIAEARHHTISLSLSYSNNLQAKSVIQGAYHNSCKQHLFYPIFTAKLFYVHSQQGTVISRYCSHKKIDIAEHFNILGDFDYLPSEDKITILDFCFCLFVHFLQLHIDIILHQTCDFKFLEFKSHSRFLLSLMAETMR